MLLKALEDIAFVLIELIVGVRQGMKKVIDGQCQIMVRTMRFGGRLEDGEIAMGQDAQRMLHGEDSICTEL